MGFGGHFFPGLGAAAGVGLVAMFARRPGWAAFAMLVAAGTLAGGSSVRSREGCIARMLQRQQWTVVLENGASAAGVVQATLVDREGRSGCRERAVLSIASGEARAGDLVRVTGSALRGERGIVIQRAAITAKVGDGSPFIRWRLRSGVAIDHLFGARAGLVRALLIADSRQIDPGMRDAFADAGLVHMLSISGLHVGIIAGAVLLLLRAFRTSLATATLGAAITTALYVVVIGARSPALRAAAMLFVVAAARLLQRPTSPWAALAIGAIVPLAAPDVVLSLGYQLSVTGMIGLIAAGTFTSRAFAPDERRLRHAIISSVAATLLATIATAPIIAWHFGRISLIAPLTNIVAAPIMLVLQPLLFLALLVAPLGPLASFVADASLPLLDLFEYIARAGASPEWGAIDVAPTLASALLAGIAAGAIIAAAASERPRRMLIAAGAAVTLIVWWPILPAGGNTGRVEVHMIDVGQGDAVAVRLPDRSWLLFDAGRSWRGGDAGRRNVVPYLRRKGGDLTGFILSHPHSDHVGGAGSVIRWLKPRTFWDAAYVAANDDYLDALRVARANGTLWQRVRPGESVAVGGGVVLEFLAPDSAWTASLDDPNDASTVAILRYGDVRILLTGDAEKEEEEWLVAKYGNRLAATILKVAHHGSRTSTTREFLDVVRPAIALVSVGAENRYGHPSQEVLANLAQSGTLVLRTDHHGSIIVATDGRRIWANVLGESWALR